MAGLAVISVEGVLQREAGDAPIGEGIALYYGLSTVYKLALITDQESSVISRWLAVHGLRIHAYLVPARPTDPLDDVERRRHQVGRLRGRGASISLVVDRSPAVVSMTMLDGIPSLLFSHPLYARPEFRPDYDGRGAEWQSIVAEIDRQSVLRDTDIRRDAEMREP